jgi:hypothetical protein
MTLTFVAVAGTARASAVLWGHVELLLEIFAQQCELKAGTPEAVQNMPSGVRSRNLNIPI